MHGAKFARGLTTTFVREAKVLSFGDGSHGALGHTDCFGGDAYEPEEIDGLPEDIVSLGAGHYHSMAVSQTGELWAWGRNSEGQLGERVDSNSREKWHLPQRVRGLESIEVVAARGSGVVSMAIARDGSLWAWGKSKRGQLGLGTNIIHAQTPQRVEALSGQHVVQVALGWGHALALTAEGHVYSWGYAANGRLGFQPNCSEPQVSSLSKDRDSGESIEDAAYRQVLEDMEKEKSPVLAWEPVRVDAFKSHHVTEISCGMDHSLTLNEQGELWSFGDNSLGQLGRSVAISTQQSSINTFTDENSVGRVEGPFTRERVLHLGAGLGHSLAANAQGSVYSWGWNAGHQLGRDGRRDNPVPASVGDLEGQEVVALAGGRAHSLAMTSKGGLWVWGSGKNGRLGLGSPADEPTPFPLECLESYSIADAACGFDHTLVLLP
ncbi:hypothetical protein KC19_1G084200 [Ceratodon purpureus]|uniref:RCC1-like domain-containing protein n=1 Tax=Ceratodon purpureus TaxID=3225 RepID=A0A8T0J5Q8_CERPU|nr:hypothetical protein KC19_1G084200 [Ceratodon purpureus]